MTMKSTQRPRGPQVPRHRCAATLVLAVATLGLAGVGRALGGETVGSPCANPSAGGPATVAYCQGVEKQERGDTDGAIGDFVHALELQPDLTDAHLLLGVGYFDRRDYGRAIEEYDKYLAVIPDNSHAWSNRAVACLRSGDLAAARADIDRAIELKPHDLPLLENRVVIARESEDFKTVITDCTWLIEHYPPKVTWLMDRGKALGAESRYAESLADFQQVVKSEPTADAYYYRGVTRYFLQQYEAAVADFSQALSLDADFAPAYLKRCTAHYYRQEYLSGIKDCDEFVRRRPDSYDGYYNRGILRSRAGDQDGALDDYRRGVELAGNALDAGNAWYGVGLSSERAGRMTEARQAYQRAVEVNPEQKQAREALRRLQK
jgi:tetratricopeptide (TPR) repeat protein